MMKNRLRRTIVFAFCLVALVLTLGIAPKSYAAASTPKLPLSGSGGACPVSLVNTGVSYDANAYTVSQIDNPSLPEPMGMFSFTGSSAPAIGVWVCGNDPFGDLYVNNVGASWYNVRTTINGVTTQMTPASNLVFNFGDHVEIDDVNVPGDGQATFQVQSCKKSTSVIGFICSAWSPTVQITTAADPNCQNGYVWREAAPFDHVCVTPTEHAQVAYDNSQAASRVDPSGADGPKSCAYVRRVQDYVWRQAFGGDDVCAAPSQRSQAAYDNSQALAHIIAL